MNRGGRRCRSKVDSARRRPFWRDYGVAYVMIGFGVLLIDAAAPRRDGARFLALPAVALLIAGFAIFFCAVGWSLWTTLRDGGHGGSG